MSCKKKSLLKFIHSLSFKAIAGPEFLFADFNESMGEFIPYIYVDNKNLENIDFVILHKGLIFRLNTDILMTLYFMWHYIYADEVYVVMGKTTFANNKFCKKFRETSKANIEKHTPPISNFIRSWKYSYNPPQKIKSALVISAYNVGNIGDDLVSLASKKMLEDVGLNDVVLSGPSANRHLIEKADLVVVGGGGLFYDADMENVANYLYPLQEAKNQNKKALVLGVGTQGIFSNLGKNIYKKHLKFVNMLSVRNVEDKKILTSIDADLENRIIVGSDMAFYLTNYLKDTAITMPFSNPIALYSLSSQLKKSFMQQNIDIWDFSKKVITKLKLLGYQIILALHSCDDKSLYMRISEYFDLRIVNLAEIGIISTASLYASASLVMTSRFHAVILGAIFDKPIISICPKNTKIYRLVNSDIRSLSSTNYISDNMVIDEFLEGIVSVSPSFEEEVNECTKKTILIKKALINALHD